MKPKNKLLRVINFKQVCISFVSVSFGEETFLVLSLETEI